MTREQHERVCRQLFEPFTIERFFAEIWPSRFFYDEPRPERLAALEKLVGMTDMDSILAAYDPIEPVTVCTGTGPGGDFAVRNVPARKAKEEFPVGNFIMRKMHQAAPALGDSVRMLERICGLPVDGELCDAHIHYSTKGEGFYSHFDDKDIIILQLRGTKTWWVSEEPFIEAPTDGYTPGEIPSHELTAYWPSHLPPDGSLRREEDVLRRFDLAPGSLLFLPRGCLHKTKALDDSITATFGFRTRSWAEVVVEKLRRKLVKDVNWRKPVHGVVPGMGPRDDEARATIEALLRQLGPAVRELEADEFIAPRRASVTSVAS